MKREIEKGSISPPHQAVDIRMHDEEVRQSRSAPLNINQQAGRSAAVIRSTTRPAGASRNFDRQMSLETGFAKAGSSGGSNNKERKAQLRRSGKSLGGIMRGAGEELNNSGKKGDFDMFRTKSTLVRQISMMPAMRKENEGDANINNNNNTGGGGNNNVESGGFTGGGGGGGGAEDGGKSVPAAGRYFAALQGPELDQVRVSTTIDMYVYVPLFEG